MCIASITYRIGCLHIVLALDFVAQKYYPSRQVGARVRFQARTETLIVFSCILHCKNGKQMVLYILQKFLKSFRIIKILAYSSRKVVVFFKPRRYFAYNAKHSNVHFYRKCLSTDISQQCCCQQERMSTRWLLSARDCVGIFMHKRLLDIDTIHRLSGKQLMEPYTYLYELGKRFVKTHSNNL